MIPLTHEQYLDEPGHVIQWMTRIGDIEDRLAAERKRAEDEQLRARLGI